MRIFPKVLAVAATALALGVATPASAHWDRWQHNHRWDPPRHHYRHHHHHHHYGWNRPYYAPRYSYSYGYRYVPPQTYYYRW